MVSRVVGDGRCRLSTHGGRPRREGILLSPLRAPNRSEPGSADETVFGIVRHLDQGGACSRAPAAAISCSGVLAGTDAHSYGIISDSSDTYFKSYRALLHRRRLQARRGGYYGLPARGRRDQRLGQRLGTAEVESALGRQPQGAEAAVVGFRTISKARDLWT